MTKGEKKQKNVPFQQINDDTCSGYLTLHNKSPPNTNNHLLSLSFCKPGIQEWLSWPVWLRVSPEGEVRCPQGLELPKGLTGAGRSTAKIAPRNMTGKLVLAFSQEPQCLCTCASPQGCFNVLIAWWLAFSRTSDSKEQVGCNTLHDLASECLLQYTVLVIQG